MKRLAIFDCDGTLIDSQHNICRAMEMCFEEAGLDRPSPDRTRAVVGLSLVEAMRTMVPDAEASFHDALADGYRQAFTTMRARGLEEEPLYDGVLELIDALDGDGWLLGVATGKSDRGLSLCLEHHGIAHRFVTLQTADRHPSKPHPSMIEAALAEAGASPRNALMIGDTGYDMAMARSAGVPAIGVTWGYHPPETLIEAGADRLADHPRDILDFARTSP
jgi:phosphoglycolate phosphatase